MEKRRPKLWRACGETKDSRKEVRVKKKWVELRHGSSPTSPIYSLRLHEVSGGHCLLSDKRAEAQGRKKLGRAQAT
jgi:hypothetical protein